MAVKKKKKTKRKKTSKIVQHSNTSNELIEKIKGNPLIVLIGIAIVVGIGIFIYSSQQGTQIALNKCIEDNLLINKNLREDIIISKCIEKHQKKISISIIETSTKKSYDYEYNLACIAKKIIDVEARKRYVQGGLASLTERFIHNQPGKYPNCETKIDLGMKTIFKIKENSNYFITEIGFTNGTVKKNLEYQPGYYFDISGKNEISYIKGVKIKLK